MRSNISLLPSSSFSLLSPSPVVLDPVRPWWCSSISGLGPSSLPYTVIRMPLEPASFGHAHLIDVDRTEEAGRRTNTSQRRSAARRIGPPRTQYWDISFHFVVRKLYLQLGKDERSDEEPVHVRGLEESRAREWILFQKKNLFLVTFPFAFVRCFEWIRLRILLVCFFRRQTAKQQVLCRCFTDTCARAHTHTHRHLHCQPKV